MSAKKPARPKKMREADRLVRNIAICVRMPNETQAHAEMSVRKHIHLSSIQNHCTETEVLRGMWARLRKGTAHRRLNEMIAGEYMRPLDFEVFERRKNLLKTFQRRARSWNKTRDEALKGAQK